MIIGGTRTERMWSLSTFKCMHIKAAELCISGWCELEQYLNHVEIYVSFFVGDCLG